MSGSDLDAFVLVAGLRSFRRAAAARGASASSFSDAVRRLETRLGVRLLNRTTRSVTPTEAGQRLLERLVPALGEVEAALDVVNAFRDTPTGVLRLNVPTIVARQVLPPIMVRFLAAHPGITLEVMTEDSFVDVLAAGCDAGIRYEERLEQDMIAVPIGPRIQRFATAAAPSYLARCGRPAHPRDLLQHACIRHRFSSGAMPVWEFQRGSEIVKINPGSLVVASNLEFELAIALSGLAVISTFEDALSPSLRSGALEPVLEEWWQSFSGPYLYFASRRHMPAPLRAFISFIALDSNPRT
jgi:DNA-binding transcriptional LysR family regulator